MRYFIDMLLGACLEVSVILFVEFFHFSKPWITLLIIGIIAPVIVLTIYAMFRHIIIRKGLVKDSILKGIVLGIPMGFLAMNLFEDVIKKTFYHQPEYSMEGFFAVGNALSDGSILITSIILSLVTSEIFLKFITKSTEDKNNMEVKWKGETMGLAVLLLPVGAALFYICIEIYNGMANDIKSDISVFLLVSIFVMSLVIVLLVYYCARGKNIRYVIGAYIFEMFILLICNIKFSLAFSIKPMEGLGILLFLGAGIYRGMERFFLRGRK